MPENQPPVITSVPPMPPAPGTMPQGRPAAPRKRFSILGLISFILLLLSLAGNAILFILVILLGIASDGGGSAHVQAERLVHGGGDKIAILPIQGVIDTAQVERVNQYCEYIKEDRSIKAVIVEVDSPGGGVTSSDEIFHLLKKLRATDRKLVVCMRGLAASGGYYVSMPAEKIYAEPTTLTGSIGVIMSTFEATEMMKKIGLKPETVKSDAAEEYKDAGSPFRPFTDADRAYFKNLINQAHVKFSKIVEDGRSGKLTEPIANIAVGKIWTADDALKLGLVDEIAYEDEVWEKTASELYLKNPTIVRLKKRDGLFEVLGAHAPMGGGKVEISVDPKSLRPAESMEMEYRYNGIR